MARAEKRQMSEPGPDRVGAVAERATGSAEMPDGQGRAGTAKGDGPLSGPMTEQPDATSRVAEWVTRFRPALVTIAMSQGVDVDTAEDVVQRASMAALSATRKNPEQVLEIASPCGWLARFVMYEARNVVRRRQRRGEILRNNTWEVLERLSPRNRCGCSVEVWVTQAVRVACQVLSDRQFQVLCRVLLLGMTDEQVAADLRIARPTVRRHRVRASQILEQALEPCKGRLPHLDARQH